LPKKQALRKYIENQRRQIKRGGTNNQNPPRLTKPKVRQT